MHKESESSHFFLSRRKHWITESEFRNGESESDFRSAVVAVTLRVTGVNDCTLPERERHSKSPKSRNKLLIYYTCFHWPNFTWLSASTASPTAFFPSLSALFLFHSFAVLFQPFRGHDDKWWLDDYDIFN